MTPSAGTPMPSLSTPHRVRPFATRFSTNATLNPLLSTFNHVFLVYCDGAYFSGSNSSETIVNGVRLYFEGKAILDHVLVDLRTRFDFDLATDIVVGGCSAGTSIRQPGHVLASKARAGCAGGISTFAHLDYIATHANVPRGALVVGFPISGYYADVPFYTNQKRFPFRQSNITDTLSAECLAKNSARPHACLVADVSAAYVTTPLFLWQSVYDADQLATSFPQPCTNATCADPYAKHLAASIERSFGHSKHSGGFVDGCLHHCGFAPRPQDDIAAMLIDGSNALQSFALWFDALTNSRRRTVATGASRSWWWQSHRHFPCDDCCPKP